MDPYLATLGEFTDRGRLETALRSSSGQLPVRAISSRFSRAAGLLSDKLGTDCPALGAYIPGRIEFLGKHTDYAGGQSLTCAVQRAFCMVAARSEDAGLSLEDQGSGSSVFIPYKEESQAPPLNWAVYPRAVVRRYVLNFGIPETGVSISFNSDIPRASGMSSSSAFVVGLWLCMAGLTRVDELPVFRKNVSTPTDLSEFLGCVENGARYRDLDGDDGVGTQGGAQDHTAILCSRASELGYFGYRPLKRLGRVALPEDLSFVIASSGVHANKTAGARQDYNDAVGLARRAAEIWQTKNSNHSGLLEHVVRSPEYSPGLFQRLVEEAESDFGIQTAILDRTRQYVQETQVIIPSAIEALASEDYGRLESLISESQKSADEGLGNQVPETRFLVDAALQSGAIASSAFGAGFGGSVYALVRKKKANAVLKKWIAAYGTRFANRLRKACFFTDATGPGAFVLGAEAERLLLESEFRPEFP